MTRDLALDLADLLKQFENNQNSDKFYCYPSTLSRANLKSGDEQTSRPPDAQAITSYDKPPDYSIAVAQCQEDYAQNHLTSTTSDTLGDPYQPKESSHADTGFSIHGATSRNPKTELPLKSLQEAKLFQHFIIRLAPWVCLHACSHRNQPDKISSSMSATAIASSARWQPVWQERAHY